MSHVFGFIVIRLICAGLNLKIWRFYNGRFGGSNMALNFGFLIWVSGYYDILIEFSGRQVSYFNCEYGATRLIRLSLVKLGMYLQLLPSWANMPGHTG